MPGHGASGGNAVGRGRRRLPHVLDVAEDRIGAAAVDAELARLHAEVDTVRAEMLALRDRLHGALSHEVGEFIDMHSLLLDDPELLTGIEDLIRKGIYGANYTLLLQRDWLSAGLADMADASSRNSTAALDTGRGSHHAAR